MREAVDADTPTDEELDQQQTLANQLIAQIGAACEAAEVDYTGVSFALWTFMTMHLAAAGWTFDELAADLRHWVDIGEAIEQLDS